TSADKMRTLVAETGECGIELFFRLDASLKVGCNTDRCQPLALDRLQDGADCGAQAPFAGIALRTEKRDRHGRWRSRHATLKRFPDWTLSMLRQFGPTRGLGQLIVSFGVGFDSGLQGILESTRILGLDRYGVLLDGGQISEESFAREKIVQFVRARTEG